MFFSLLVCYLLLVVLLFCIWDLGFPLRGCCLAHNKWYQSFPGSSWDYLEIRRASVADLVEMCVDLRSALVLFVGSCVDLRTRREVLKESLKE